MLGRKTDACEGSDSSEAGWTISMGYLAVQCAEFYYLHL